ncbi:hypothetical protein WT73_05995 [Burkholderia stagnalis]|nr:hypothetical protein WT73_05995 [Burkholderia stagnalis]
MICACASSDASHRPASRLPRAPQRRPRRSNFPAQAFELRPRRLRADPAGQRVHMRGEAEQRGDRRHDQDQHDHHRAAPDGPRRAHRLPMSVTRRTGSPLRMSPRAPRAAAAVLDAATGGRIRRARAAPPTGAHRSLTACPTQQPSHPDSA